MGLEFLLGKNKKLFWPHRAASSEAEIDSSVKWFQLSKVQLGNKSIKLMFLNFILHEFLLLKQKVSLMLEMIQFI